MNDSDATRIDKYAQHYIAIRDKLKAMEEAHDLAKAPFLEIQNKLQGRIMAFLDATGQQNAKTKYGTCGTSTRYTASLSDPDAFMKFVVDNKRFDLLDRRANSTVVREYVKEHNVTPPGANLNAIRTVSVTRPRTKAE